MPCVTIPTVPPAAANSTNNKEDKRTSSYKTETSPENYKYKFQYNLNCRKHIITESFLLRFHFLLAIVSGNESFDIIDRRRFPSHLQFCAAVLASGIQIHKTK